MTFDCMCVCVYVSMCEGMCCMCMSEWVCGSVCACVYKQLYTLTKSKKCSGVTPFRFIKIH